VKYLAHFEIPRESLDSTIKTWRERREGGRTVKTLFQPHTLAETSEGVEGFLVFEAEGEEEIARYVTEYLMAGAKIRVTPIWESSLGVDVYEKIRKKVERRGRPQTPMSVPHFMNHP